MGRSNRIGRVTALILTVAASLVAGCNLQTAKNTNDSQPLSAGGSGGSGGSGGTGGTSGGTPTPVTTTFVYVSSQYSSPGPAGILTYSLNRATGGLTEVPNSFADTGNNSQPESLIATPDGQFLYLADAGQKILTFSINRTTGVLTETGAVVVPSVVSPGFGLPWGIDVHPSGKYLYATQSANPNASGNSRVLMYSINTDTGALTSMGFVDAGNISWRVKVHPSGKFVYVTNLYSSTVGIYTVNLATGGLTAAGTMPTGPCPDGLAIDSSGTHLYAAYMNGTTFCAGGVDMANGGISQFTINTTTGALTAAGNVPFTGHPVEIAVDAAGKFAYVSTQTTVQTYSIGANGALTAGASVSDGAYNLALDASSGFLVTSGFGQPGSTSSFRVNSATGALTAGTNNLPIANGAGGGITAVNLVN